MHGEILPRDLRRRAIKEIKEYWNKKAAGVRGNPKGEKLIDTHEIMILL